MSEMKRNNTNCSGLIYVLSDELHDEMMIAKESGLSTWERIGCHIPLSPSPSSSSTAIAEKGFSFHEVMHGKDLSF
jgi:hypothetical protein